MAATLGRRSFVKASASLALAFAVQIQAQARGRSQAGQVTAFLQIDSSGAIRLYSPTTEMGQGTHTATAST